MRASHEPWYIVCLRVGYTGSDIYLGPYRTYDNAARVSNRLNRDIAARGAEEELAASVEKMSPATDIEDFRDTMLRDLEASGYVHKGSEVLR